MTVESVTQAVSNLALQFGEEDADPGAMVSPFPLLCAKTLLYSNLKQIYIFLMHNILFVSEPV